MCWQSCRTVPVQLSPSEKSFLFPRLAPLSCSIHSSREESSGRYFISHRPGRVSSDFPPGLLRVPFTVPTESLTKCSQCSHYPFASALGDFALPFLIRLERGFCVPSASWQCFRGPCTASSISLPVPVAHSSKDVFNVNGGLVAVPIMDFPF